MKIKLTNLAIMAFIIMVQISCQAPQEYVSDDLQELNLNGKVKSVSETCHKVIEKFGETALGDIDRGVISYARDEINRDYLKSFNIDGMLTKVEYFHENKKVSNNVDYEYSNGKLLQIVERVYSKYGKLDSKIKYDYNENGNLVEETAYEPSGSILAVKKYKFEGGYLVEENCVLEDGSLHYKSMYTNNSNGNCLKEIVYGSDGSESATAEYEYDSKSNIIKNISKRSDAFGLSVEHVNTFEYNSKNQLTFEKDSRMGGNWSTSYSYDYDSNGNVVKLEIYGGNKKLTDTWTYDYKYDSYGNWTERTELENSIAKFKLKRIIEYHN